MKSYAINEVFYSVQGEGMRCGQASVFVRFSGCNLQCDLEPGPKSPGGFKCDTEFAGAMKVDAKELLAMIERAICVALDHDPSDHVFAKMFATTHSTWVVCTGGEPALQLDYELCDFLHRAGYRIAVETNGSKKLPQYAEHLAPPDSSSTLDKQLATYCVDWITVSPKVAEHAIEQLVAHEVKYVRGYQQALPRPRCIAKHYLLSPAFNGLTVDRLAAQWCVQLVKHNPQWAITTQLHKAWNAR